MFFIRIILVLLLLSFAGVFEYSHERITPHHKEKCQAG
jgi:hypothetical protein